MRKAILLSIRPNWVRLILNKKKIYEIRKQFPKDYVGWVYIYCCKHRKNEIGFHINYEKVEGKVVARFWCDKVLELRPFSYGGHIWWIERTTTNYKQFLQILQRSSLTAEQIKDYAKRKRELFAVVVDKLEIFDKPRELSEFYTTHLDKTIPEIFDNSTQLPNGVWVKPLTKAPQNWCYIEIN